MSPPEMGTSNVYPDDRERFLEAIREITENHVPIDFEYRLVTPLGEIRFVREISEPEFDENGVHVRSLGTVQDITERKQVEEALRESESRYQSIVEDQTELIIRFNTDGIRTFANQAFCRFVGKSSDDLMGASLYDDVPREEWEYLKAHFVSLTQENNRSEYINQVIRPDGECRSIQWVDRAIFDDQGQVVEFQCVGRDITERKEIDKMKSEFISIASHELRTPLTSLMGALGLINSSLVGKIPEKVAPILEIAYRNSERLSRLIDDILSIEKLDAGKSDFSMQPLPISSLIDQAISEHDGYGIEHNVSFVVDGDVPNVAILGDEDRLMQVFSNLMSNAAKYSPKGTVVQLSASERGGAFVYLYRMRGKVFPRNFARRYLKSSHGRKTPMQRSKAERVSA